MHGSGRHCESTFLAILHFIRNDRALNIVRNNSQGTASGLRRTAIPHTYVGGQSRSICRYLSHLAGWQKTREKLCGLRARRCLLLDFFGTRQVSLEGARCAEAWSGINAFNGCGFDLVWAGGRTWSLLCDDPLSRKSWVRNPRTRVSFSGSSS